MKNVVILFLCLFIVSISAHGHGLRFKVLQELAQKEISAVGEESFNAMVQVRPSGDIVYLSMLHGNKEQWYFSVIDKNGQKTINNKLIGEYMNTSPRTYNYSWGWIENPANNITILTEGDDRLYVRQYTNGDEKISKVYDVSTASNPILLNDKNGTLFAFTNFKLISRTLGIYKLGANTDNKQIPILQSVTKPILSKAQETFCAATTNDDNIIVCLRSNDLLPTWDDKKAFYGIYNFKGTEVLKLHDISIKSSAYCKVKNVALPGVYEYSYTGYDQNDKKVLKDIIGYGYDIVNLPNGQMVFAVTAFDDDKTSLCTYLIKLESGGKIIKPGAMMTVNAKSVGDGVSPVNRAGWTSTSTYKSNAPLKYDMVLYSFDEDGNLFTEKIPLGEFKNR